MRLMRIVIMCKMTPIGVRLNLENFIVISYAILELLRKVSQGGGIRPPGEIGLMIKILTVGYNRWLSAILKPWNV